MKKMYIYIYIIYMYDFSRPRLQMEYLSVAFGAKRILLRDITADSKFTTHDGIPIEQFQGRPLMLMLRRRSNNRFLSKQT